MRIGVSEFGAKVLLLGHHVAHGTGFWKREFMLVERRFNGIRNLRFGQSLERQFGGLKSERQVGACGLRVEAKRQADGWIPKFRILEWLHPRSFEDTDKTVLTLGSDLITVGSQYVDFRILRYGLRGCSSRKRNFAISVRHQVLINRSHAGIGRCIAVPGSSLRFS